MDIKTVRKQTQVLSRGGGPFGGVYNSFSPPTFISFLNHTLFPKENQPFFPLRLLSEMLL